MISIRLSEEEYLALRELCTATGARSVSDLTREAMRELFNGSARDETLGNRMDVFCDRICNLGRKIKELEGRVASSKSELES